MNKIIFNLLILFILLFSNNPSANELLLYADNISYDSNKNIIAKGNAKIIKDGEIISTTPRDPDEATFGIITLVVYFTEENCKLENFSNLCEIVNFYIMFFKVVYCSFRKIINNNYFIFSFFGKKSYQI